MRKRPPALARLLVTIAVPPGRARNGVIGDLFEMYTDRLSRDGAFRAALWYWKEALHATSRY